VIAALAIGGRAGLLWLTVCGGAVADVLSGEAFTQARASAAWTFGVSSTVEASASSKSVAASRKPISARISLAPVLGTANDL